MRWSRRRHTIRWNGHRLVVPDDVFHPRLYFSTALLAGVLEQRELSGRRVLDVGCGSGVLALTAARCGAHVTAIDINPSAIEATRSNSAACGLAVETLQSDLFAAVTGRHFDLVVVNPPYFAKDPSDAAEHAWFAGSNLDYFPRFFAGLADVTDPASTCVGLMVLGEACDLATITRSARERGFELCEVRRRSRLFAAQVVYELAPAHASL